MSFLMSLVVVVSISADKVDHTDLAFAHPSAPIVCPVFVDNGHKVSMDRQYDLCLKRVVKPLERICIEEGFGMKECHKRTIIWIIKQQAKQNEGN